MKRIVYILTGICLVLAVAAGILLAIPPKPSEDAPAAFVPPEFDKNALSGTPSVPEELRWVEIYKDGMSFRAKICVNVQIKKNVAKIYFTNPAENTLWLKVRAMGEDGSVFGETGLIKPGEYLPEIIFDTLPADGEKITFKLMSYQPETYYSGGSVPVTTIAHLQGD